MADPVVETDIGWIGTPFILMPRVEGHIIGALAFRDRWLVGPEPPEQRQVYENFIAMMSRIHRADAGAAPAVARRDNSAELDFWDEYLAWSSEGRRCPHSSTPWPGAAPPPADEPAPALLWGDARFENAVIGDDLELLAVLDWDMTSVGAPEHDLAWFTSLDLTMHHVFGERLMPSPTGSGPSPASKRAPDAGSGTSSGTRRWP